MVRLNHVLSQQSLGLILKLFLTSKFLVFPFKSQWDYEFSEFYFDMISIVKYLLMIFEVQNDYRV